MARARTMSRRGFLGAVGGALLASTAPGLICGTARAAERQRQPNIIYILADDLGYGDLGIYGQTHFPTPRLDRMAAEGLRFTQHYAGSTVCAPSRACLLTGQHTGHVSMRGNGPHALRPDPQDLTIARRLTDAGYHTAMIGKSGLAATSDDGAYPKEKGFDHFFGFTSHADAHRHYPQWLWRNGQRIDYPENQGKEGQTYANELFVREAERYIEQQQAGPFFLHLALTLPHADLAVPDAYRQPFVGKFDEKPSADNHYRAETMPKATYAGMVSFIDAAVGRILDRLTALALAETTLVVFSSDNGSYSEGGYHHSDLDSNQPLRGGKRDLFEGGIRVPHLAWWPGTIAPGVSDHISAFWDFVPTACELAGANVPEGIDGISYAPTLRNRGTQRQHDHLYWEFYGRGGHQAVRRGRWKAIKTPVDRNLDGPIKLFDLDADLGEKKNLADQHPDLVQDLDRLMRACHTPSPVFRFPAAQRRNG